MEATENTLTTPEAFKKVVRVGLIDIKFDKSDEKKKLCKSLGLESPPVLHKNDEKKTKKVTSKKNSTLVNSQSKNMKNLFENLRKQCSLSDLSQQDKPVLDIDVIKMALNDIKEWKMKTEVLNEQKKEHQNIQVKMLKKLISLLKESPFQNDDILKTHDKSSLKKTKKDSSHLSGEMKKFNFRGFISPNPTYRDKHGYFTAERLFASTPSSSLSESSRIFPHFPLSSSVLEEISQMDFVFKPTFGNSFFSSHDFSGHMKNVESGGLILSPFSSVTKKGMKKKRKMTNKLKNLPGAQKRAYKKTLQPKLIKTVSAKTAKNNLNEGNMFSTNHLNHYIESNQNDRAHVDNESDLAHVDNFLEEEEPYPRVDSPCSMDSNILFNSKYIRRLTSVTRTLRENEIQLLHQNLRLRSPSSKNTRSKISISVTPPMKKGNASPMRSPMTPNKKFYTSTWKKIKIVTPTKFKTVVTSKFKIITPNSERVPSKRFKSFTPKSSFGQVGRKRTSSNSSAKILLQKDKKIGKKASGKTLSSCYKSSTALPTLDPPVSTNTEEEMIPATQNNGAFQRAAPKGIQRKLNATSTARIEPNESPSVQTQNSNNFYSPAARTIVHVPLNNIVNESDQLLAEYPATKAQSSLIVTDSIANSLYEVESPQQLLRDSRRSSPHHHFNGDSINKRVSPHHTVGNTHHQVPQNIKEQPKLYYPVHPFISHNLPVHFIPVDANNVPDFLPLYAPASGTKASPKMYPSFVQIRHLEEDAPGAQYDFSNGIYSKNVPRRTLPEKEILPNLLKGISAAAKNPLVLEMNHLRVIKGVSKPPTDGKRAVSPILGSRRKSISPVKSSWTSNPSTSNVTVRSPSNNNTMTSNPSNQVRLTSQQPMVVKLAPPPSMKQVINIQRKIHRCNQCNFTTVKLGVFKRHQLSHDKPDSPPDSNEEILIIDSKIRTLPPPTSSLNPSIQSSVKITQAPGPAPAPLVAHSDSLRLGPNGGPMVLSPTRRIDDSEMGIKIVSTESLKDSSECHRNSSFGDYLDSAPDMPLQKRFPSVTITPLLQPFD